MIERVLELFPTEWPCTFVLSSNHKETNLSNLLRELRPNANIVWIDENFRKEQPFKGPALAVYEGLKVIEPEDSVLVSYCDYGMIWDAKYFERFVHDTNCDACLISYRGFHAHYLSPTMYAYSQLNGELVRSVREKGSFTSNRETEYASSGAYYFKSAVQLKLALEWQVEDKLEVQNEHYTSLTVEALLQRQPTSNVRVFEVPGFCQWGTPEDLKIFEYWERVFKIWNREQRKGESFEVAQVLMPMAGRGSRFQSLTKLPKPYIRIGDTPMFKLALESLPKAKHTVVVSLEEHIAFWSDNHDHTKHLTPCFLKTTPAGQALSSEAGLAHLNPNDEVLVTACDHEIVLSEKKWADFHRNPDCDAAIFTVQGFPGAARKPKSFAYVIPANSSDPFPTVKSVSVKEPVSDSPTNDHLLVGTFWFKSAAILDHYLQVLKARDLRVNGELYLDSIFTVLIEHGLKVRMIPLDGYICRGDPDALAESVYFEELFGGRSLTYKGRYLAAGSS